MSKIVRVQDGDYKLIVGSESSEGYIYLDTNPNGITGFQGKVTITGDLLVMGNTTTVSSETLTVVDPIIVVNQGELNPGVATAGTRAGIEIDRGIRPNAFAIWDESIDSYDPSGTLIGEPDNNFHGSFIFKDANENLRAIVTNTVNTLGGDLALITQGNGVITVSGTTNYETQILDYTALVASYDIASVSRTTNVATVTMTSAPSPAFTAGRRVFVTCSNDGTFSGSFITIISAVGSSFTYANPGIDLPSTVATGTVRPDAIIDDDNIPNMRAVADYTANVASLATINRILENDTKVQVYDFDTSGVSEITFEVDGIERAVINSSGLTVNNIRIQNNNIFNIATENVLLGDGADPKGGVLNIANRSLTSVPSTPLGYVKLYSRDVVGTGGTGLYFVNTLGTGDELISKTKAFLYSLIL
jgi:hypothetical protein